MHNFTTSAAPAEFSDRDNDDDDDDVFIFSAPFKSKPQREREREGEGRRRRRKKKKKKGKQRKSHLHLFFGVWSGAERRGAARRARVFLMLRDAAPFSFLSFLLFLRLRRPAG